MLKLSLVTPAKKVVTDLPIEEIFVPTQRGELNILEGHSPLLGVLQTGILKYRPQGESKTKDVAISFGYLDVSKDQVTVLAETAETPEEIDIDRAKKAKEKAEKYLDQVDVTPEDFRKYQLKLQRAVLRIQASIH